MIHLEVCCINSKHRNVHCHSMASPSCPNGMQLKHAIRGIKVIKFRLRIRLKDQSSGREYIDYVY